MKEMKLVALHFEIEGATVGRGLMDGRMEEWKNVEVDAKKGGGVGVGVS